MIAGYEVYGIPATSNGDRALHKLFDLRGVNTLFAPRGIAYIASERVFALSDPYQPTLLFVCDEKGEPMPPRTIQYLGGFFPVQTEALAYLPPTSQPFPDHLVMVATDDFNNFRLEIMRLDGQVVAEIHLPTSVARTGYVSGVGFAAPDRLLVGAIGEIWAVDFAGTIVGGPIASNPEAITNRNRCTRSASMPVHSG